MIKPAIVGCAAVAAVAAMQPPAAPAILFRDITREAGVTFRNQIVEGVGGRQILIEDPSGNCVELFEPGPAARSA